VAGIYHRSYRGFPEKPIKTSLTSARCEPDAGGFENLHLLEQLVPPFHCQAALVNVFAECFHRSSPLREA